MIAQQSVLLDAPVHALIDTGALVTGMSNLQVAEYLVARGLPLKGVIYFDEDNVQMIYEALSRASVRVEDSSIPVSSRFSFYDQVHTTGTDIKQAPNVLCIAGLNLRPPHGSL